MTATTSQRRVRMVTSFEELVGTPFAGDVNALCWPRTLPGDFQEVADALQTDSGITTIDESRLRALALSPAGAAARETLLADQALLRRHGLQPVLDCVVGQPRDGGAGPYPIDVASFHVDTADVEADTYLCTYLGACSEGLPNEHAIRRIDDPASRARLLEAYGAADDDGFAAYLEDNFHHLHYIPASGAATYSFGRANLWRIAIQWPGCRVLPCVHRAPLSPPGAPTRLLLIS